MKILLNNRKSKKTVNINNSLAVDVKNSKRALPIDDLRTSLSELDLYNYERQSSDKIRLTCTINTVCSNVLFNPFTEIVKDEGSDSGICLNLLEDTISNALSSTNIIGKNVKTFTSISDCIRDTQLSNEKNGFIYHCGTDIFNNHILRSKTFKSNCLLPNNGTHEYFNTIADFARTTDGITISGYTNASSENVEKQIKLRLYLNEDILSFKDCKEERLIEKNGWFGFTNISNFKTNSESDMSFNKVINNRMACDFIDMYPSRDLFYFTPKYNNFRNRMEKNWDYFLTYPYSSTTKDIPFIYDNGLKIYKFNSGVKNRNGVSSLRLSSIVKHGLLKDDIINLYSVRYGKLISDIKIYSVEDLYSFSINASGIDLDNDDTLYFKKVVDNEEVEYYVRLFKKLNNKEYESHLGKLAFSRNIYNDDIAEVVYTDDINIEGLYDNLGRPLTSIYFTILKTHKGNEQWYVNKNTNSSDIEYSHCFSNLTCGFEYDKQCTNVYGDIKSMYSDNKITDVPCKIGNDDVYYGDICYYSNSTATETILQPIGYRFNTYQREHLPFGDKINYDEITSDDFDSAGFSINGRKADFFKNTKEKYKMSIENKNEGYFYYPHFEIPIKSFSKTLNVQKPIFLTIKNLINRSVDKNKLYEFYTNENHELLMQDIVDLRVYDSETQTNTYYEGTVIDILSNKKFILSFTDNVSLLNEDKKHYRLLKRDPNIPLYASLTKRDSSMYLWRDIIENGFDTETNIETYPFTNGALYIHQNFNLYVKRQDPHGYGGIKDIDVEANILDETKENNYYNEEDITC